MKKQSTWIDNVLSSLASFMFKMALIVIMVMTYSTMEFKKEKNSFLKDIGNIADGVGGIYKNGKSLLK